MKTTSSKPKKLRLATQTLRHLSPTTLNDVAGGALFSLMRCKTVSCFLNDTCTSLQCF